MRRNPNVPSAHPAAAVARRLTVGFDPLRISLFLLFLFTVSRIHQHFGPLARLRPALLLVMITAGYAFLNPRFLNTQGLFRTWPAKVIAGLGVLACLSAAFGISLGGSARFILDDYSKVLVFAFLLIAGIRHTRDLYTFVWAYVLSCGILAYLSLFVFQLKRTNDGMMRLSNLYTFDANDVGLVMVVGLPLALLVYQVAKGKAKLGAGIILVGIGATIARTGSRGAFVGVMVVGLALLVMLKTIPVAKRLMFLGVTVVALAVAAPAGYWEQMKTIFEPTEDYNYTSVNGRKQVALRGLGYMLSYPVFGIGINNFWRAECFMSSKALDRVPGQGIRCTAPHNSFVQAGSELGIPGLVVYCSLVFGVIVGLRRLRRRIPRSWARGDPEQRFLSLALLYVPVAMIGYAVTSSFVSFAWIDIVYILAAYASGLYLCVGQKRRDALVTAPGMQPARAGRRAGPMPVPAPVARRRLAHG